MNRILLTALLCVASAACATAQQTPPDHVERIERGTSLFRASVRDVLIEECLKCHGGEKVRSGFDLSTRKLLLQGGDSGEVVDLKDPASSYLLGLIRHDDEPTMPPAKEKLDEKVIQDIATWIELGAPYDKPLIAKDGAAESAAMQVTESDRDFWSFRPLQESVPPVTNSDWPRNAIDQFTYELMANLDLKPSAAVSKQSRIRRAYLDVIGLPPTLEQLRRAEAMSHADLVEELLSSPHYGERWARHWLDAARFAESHGFEQDYDRKYAYHYRDFVIKALNADMPWDRFVRLQLAGDELEPENPLALMATGFLGAGVFPTQLTEKEFESARYDELDDMAATVGTAMLGLTIGCARCHDHKFDPIPVKDYYQFVSTFTQTIRSEIDVDLDPSGYQEKLQAWKAAYAEAVEALAGYEQSDSFQLGFGNWINSVDPDSLFSGGWTSLAIEGARSTGKSTKLVPQEDRAILATGKAASKETYVLQIGKIEGPISHLRIEALTHASMNRNGPGRAGNGNFALSDLQFFAVSGGKKRKLTFASATATHEQNKENLSVVSSIDADDSGTGWAVDFGGIGEDQAAVFSLAEELSPDQVDSLELRLVFKNNAQHSLGRFRISACLGTNPQVIVGGGVSPELHIASEALSKGEVEAAHRKVLQPLFAKTDQDWRRLKRIVDLSLEEKPRPEKVKVQVSSEGFPPTKHHADGRGFPHFYPETFHLSRGDPNQKGEVAEQGFLQVLMRNGKSASAWQMSAPEAWRRTSYKRASLANWITDVDSGAGHLLARVIVNRLWHHHFGRGIVSTPNDFGLQGTLPSHPELLDYLATKLIENDWKLKEIHREILLSATWLQSTQGSEDNEAIDPENRLLWRYPTRRLEAEVVRDSLLSASGQLDSKMYGAGTLDPNHRRRSIYFMIKRSKLIPFMQIFDQPEPLSSQGTRPSTTIAPQALLFMNNPQVVLWAGEFAKSVEHASDGEAIEAIYLRALSRKPSKEELSSSQQFLTEQTESYSDAAKARQLALADLCQVVFGLNEFIYMP